MQSGGTLFPAVTQQDLVARAERDTLDRCLEVGRALRRTRGSAKMMQELLAKCRALAEVTDGPRREGDGG